MKIMCSKWIRGKNNNYLKGGLMNALQKEIKILTCERCGVHRFVRTDHTGREDICDFCEVIEENAIRNIKKFGRGVC
jgi:hypothetical protein